MAPDGLALKGVCWERHVGGSPSGPPLVFTPGNGFPVQVYEEAFGAMSKSRGSSTTVWALNPRGIGGSEVPPSFDSWDPLLAEIRAFVESRLEPPVLLGGHSMGAMLSLRLAAESPELVAGLLLLEPVVRAGRGKPWQPLPRFKGRNLIDATRTRRERWPSLGEAMNALGESPGYREWQPGPLGAFRVHGLKEAGLTEAGLEDAGREGVSLACPAWLEAAIYEAVPKEVLFDWAERIQCPAVILRGASSRDSVPTALEELTEILPVAALLAVKGSHAFPMEHPASTGSAMAAALGTILGETLGPG